MVPNEWVDRYREQGFLHVPGVLTADETAKFLDAAEQALVEHETVKWDLGAGHVAFDWVPDVDQRSPVLRRLALHPRVTEIATALTGGRLRLFKSELLRKRPAGEMVITPAHDDRKTWPFTGSPAPVTAWVALVDVPVERGCMSFIPGSHLRSPAAEADQDRADVYPLSYWPELAAMPRITVPLLAGDVTFHHDRTIHLAGANRTEVTRIAQTTVYMPESATFRHSKYYAGWGTTDPDLGGLQPGQPLDGPRFPTV